MEKNNQILRINDTLFFSVKKIKKLKERLCEFFSSNKVLSMKDFKEIAKTTRKYAVPLLEYFDKVKFTFRVENGRKLL